LSAGTLHLVVTTVQHNAVGELTSGGQLKPQLRVFCFSLLGLLTIVFFNKFQPNKIVFILENIKCNTD